MDGKLVGWIFERGRAHRGRLKNGWMDRRANWSIT